MKSVRTLCAILLLAGGLMAQTSTKPKTSTKKAAESITAADVQSLKEAIAAQSAALAQQQKQIQELRDELRRKDQVVQQAQTAASDAATKADAAQNTASQQQAAVTALKTDVEDVKGSVASAVVNLQETQKRVSEAPTTIRFKGITITPGGFLAAESVYRSHALGSGINTPLNAVPMSGASANNISEFFGSGRQSRVALLAEGKAGAVKMGGYYEADFLSAGVTSNNNQSNSYTLRQRQVWAQAALDSGWTVTGGQQWSLVTETKSGMDNRSEALPMTIDPQYHVGFSWTRQYGFRVTKKFNNKVWLGVSAENAQATLTSHGNAANFLLGSAGVTGGLYNNQSNYSFNPSPDIIGKIVFEPGFGHYEVFGIFSRFRDRVFPCQDIAATDLCGGSATPGPNALAAFNDSKSGGGAGANARWSVMNKHIDIGLHGVGGSGVGRYGTSGLPDVAVHADGRLYLVKSLQGLSTLEFHHPKIDVYFNVGAEYAGRAGDFDPVTGKYVGYGSPLFSNTGCGTETLPGSGGFVPGSLGNCTADTRALIEGTAGFWHKIHSGPHGRIQWGLQYSHLARQTWSGVGGDPSGSEDLFYTSFRYYLP